MASKEQIEQAVANAPEIDSMLYMLLASSGLRIGEALAVRIGYSEKSSCLVDGTIVVRTSLWNEVEQAPKTPSAIRTVELARPVADRLQEFVARRSGYLFGNGVPAKQSTLRAHLDALVLPGFHSFRRFRTTTLRAAQTPEDIAKHWLGHSSANITDRYSKLSQNAELRREWAEKIGAGFAL